MGGELHAGGAAWGYCFDKCVCLAQVLFVMEPEWAVTSDGGSTILCMEVARGGRVYKEQTYSINCCIELSSETNVLTD
jgi:hypothetical protein